MSTDDSNTPMSLGAKLRAFAARKKQRHDDKAISRKFRRLAIKDYEAGTQYPDVEFMVYYGDGKAEGHFDLWNPVFEASGTNYVSVVRYSIPWREIRKHKNVLPVGSIKQVTPLLERMPNLKAIFYPANNGVNIQTVRNSKLCHIFLGHGDSDKDSSANKVFRLYDEVWTAGQNHIDRFKNIDASFASIDFRIVGQPWMKSWLETLPEHKKHERVDWGYFPTWEGYFQNSDYSSLTDIEEYVAAINDVLAPTGTGFFKLHPRTLDEEVDVIDGLVPNLACDVSLEAKENTLRSILSKPLQFVVCDISAAVTECLYIDVPIFLYRPKNEALVPDNFEETNSFCYIFSTPKELAALLKTVFIDGIDARAADRKEFLTYRTDIQKTRSDQFASELERLRNV